MSPEQARQSWSRWWFPAALLMSAACVAVTLLAGDMANIGYVMRRLGTFSLSGENSIGAWWSGTLLLIIGLHAFDGFFRYRSTPRIARAWLVLGIVMSFLAMDEISSVHERIHGGMLMMAAICGLGGAFTIISLFFSSQRRTSFWLAAGFAILAFAMIQDDFLQHMQIWVGHMRFRQMLEEGTELFAMLLFVRVTMVNTFGSDEVRNDASHVMFGIIPRVLPGLMVAGMVIAPLLAYFSDRFPDHLRGHTASWQAGAALFLAALLVLPGISQPKKGNNLSRYSLAALCLAFSASAVFINPYFFNSVNKVVFSLFCTALGVLWFINTRKGQREFHGLLGATCASLMLLVWVHDSLLLTYWVEAAMAMLVLYGNATLDQQRVLITRPAPAAVPIRGLSDPAGSSAT